MGTEVFSGRCKPFVRTTKWPALAPHFVGARSVARGGQFSLTAQFQKLAGFSMSTSIAPDI